MVSIGSIVYCGAMSNKGYKKKSTFPPHELSSDTFTAAKQAAKKS
jgi:hypothetical protein